MNLAEEPTYGKVMQEIALYVSQSKMTSPRIQGVWGKLAPFLNANMTKHGCPADFHQEINKILSILDYPHQEKEGPFCSKVVNSYIACADCATKAQSSACFCVECFTIEKHSGHNFRLVQKCQAVCDCGDRLSVKKEGFCRMHVQGKFKEPDKNLSRIQSAIKEMQFLVFVMAKLDSVKANFTDDSKKKEYFTSAVINKLTQLTERGYSNKYAAARFLSSKMIDMQMPGKSYLWKMTTQRKTWLNQRFNSVLLRLYTVDLMRYQVINQIFDQLTSKDGKMDVKSPLCKVMFQYANSRVETVAALKNFGPLLVNNKDLTIEERQNTYLALFYFYRLLLKQKSVQITTHLIKDLNITGLVQFYIPRLQRSHRFVFFKLETEYFDAMLTILKAVIQMRQNDYLIKMVKDCFNHIRNKTPSPCFSVERTFALAFFAHVDYDVENIIDMDQEALMELLGENDEQLLIVAIESALKKSLALLKMDNIADLKRMVYCDDKVKNSHLIFSADHIYLKVLFYLLMRLQPNVYDISEPLSSYITARVRSIDILLEMWQAQEISKLEETIEMYFYEFASVTTHLVYLSETSIYELIATCSLDPNSVRKQSAFEFIEFITYVFEPAHMKDLRAKTISYINNDKIIEQFVKTAYQKYKDKIIQGALPKNYFNISYSSLYLQFKGFKEASSMYELKLRNYCRTRLSGYIFNQDILDRLFQLFSYMFDVFLKYFKNTEVINSKLIMGSAVECSILLALETKDKRFDQLALKFQEQYQLTNKLASTTNNSVYYRELILMYKQSQNQLALEKSQALVKTNQIEPTKKIRENAALKIKKLNELKQKQRTVLANNKETLDSIHTAQLKQGVHSCTVCKNTSNREQLFYLCHMRFSNFVKTTKFGPEKKRKVPESPILVISTCGHAVHLSCLKRTVGIPQQEDTLLFDFQCFLCKANSNTIFPIASQHHPLIQTFDMYGTLLTTIIPELICEYSSICKYINVDRLRISDLFLNSLAETIYEYAIQFPRYLVTKLLPIIREEVSFLRAYEARPEHATLIAHLYETARTMNTKSYGDEGVLWVKIALMEITNNKKTCQEVRKNIDMSFALPESHRAASERIWMILHEITSKQAMGPSQLVAKYDLKDNYDVLTPLPYDLLKFNSLIGKCPTCRKVTSKIRACIVCGFKSCKDCTEQLFKHVQLHLDSTGFINVENGVCHLYFGKDQIIGNHLYLNYAGEYIPDHKLFPKEGEYTLSIENRNYLFQILLNDNIRGEIIERGMRHSPCEVQ